MTDDRRDPAWRRLIRDRIAALPDQPVKRLAGLQEVRHSLHEELAKAAEPVFNAILRTMDRGDIESRRELCTWANAQLRSLGLAVRCGRTGRPAILVADVRDANDTTGRFRLEIRDAAGRVLRTLSNTALPDLSLVEDTPREESFARAFRRRPKDGPAR